MSNFQSFPGPTAFLRTAQAASELPTTDFAFTSTATSFIPTQTYASTQGSTSAPGRQAMACLNANYARIAPLINATSLSYTLHVIGWSKAGATSSMANNLPTYVPYPLASVTVTTGTVTVTGSLIGAASFALINGDAKFYGSSAVCPVGFMLVDLCGCDMLTLHPVGPDATSRSFRAYIGLI